MNSLNIVGIKCKSEKATLLIRDVRFDFSLFLLSYLNDFKVVSNIDSFSLGFYCIFLTYKHSRWGLVLICSKK